MLMWVPILSVLICCYLFQIMNWFFFSLMPDYSTIPYAHLAISPFFLALCSLSYIMNQVCFVCELLYHSLCSCEYVFFLYFFFFFDRLCLLSLLIVCSLFRIMIGFVLCQYYPYYSSTPYTRVDTVPFFFIFCSLFL